MKNTMKKAISGGLIITTISSNTTNVEACDTAVLEAAVEASSACPYIAPFLVAGAIVVTGVTTVIGIKNKTTESEYVYYTLGRLPDYWRPHSVMDKVNPNGRIIQRRIYGSDGRAKLDLDLSDHGTPKYHPWVMDGQPLHAHDYDHNKQKSRRPGREITEKEYQKYIKEIDKINVNRRYRMKLDQSDYDRLNGK